MRMIVKLGGLLCIFVAACMAGYEMDRRLKQRWLFLREVAETLQLLEKEMTWLRTPLPEALKEAAGNCRTAFAPMLLACAELVTNRDRCSFGEIWRVCAAQELPKGLLSEAEYQALLEVEGALCNSDTVLQKTHLNRQQQRFRDLSDRAKEEWQEKGRLCRRLSAAAGLSLAILLL
ncbi:MAG: stage III sporulation protein AB [Lachnospiraceae bacterium]|nr:stage III sporulation protein AB [Lachnospiraceae bacterium]